MKNLQINGTFANSNGGSTIITISGPNGYSHQETRSGNFSISNTVNSGLYVIYIHGKTDGTLILNITGNLTGVDPKVPMNLRGNFSQVFHATISS
jgi:hypothetical protein